MTRRSVRAKSRTRVSLWQGVSVFLLLAACARPSAEPLRVAAASDLTEAFTELGAQFEAKTQTKVVFSFGSSGLLAKQLSEGAPFDVFAAANARFVDDTVTAGACEGATKQPYARGKLAAWSAKKALPSLEMLLDDDVKRIAIANPEHAPYGKAAKEALEKAGLWERVQSKIVSAENVRQALQLAQTGNAEVALVAYSNVIGRKDGQLLLMDEALYAPLEQSMVVCRRGKQAEAARAFVQFLKSDGARAVMGRYGFTIP